MNTVTMWVLIIALVVIVLLVMWADRKHKKDDEAHRKLMREIEFLRAQRAATPHTWNETPGHKQIDTKPVPLEELIRRNPAAYGRPVAKPPVLRDALVTTGSPRRGMTDAGFRRYPPAPSITPRKAVHVSVPDTRRNDDATMGVLAAVLSANTYSNSGDASDSTSSNFSSGGGGNFDGGGASASWGDSSSSDSSSSSSGSD